MMVGVYHSTSINLVSKACPYALQLQEDGKPYDRTIFQVGIAAHAVIEGVALCCNEVGRALTQEETEASALGVCERLISVGRSYDGKGEPPMSPDSVFAGQDLALQWLAWYPMQPGGKVELGLGLDADGQPCDYWKGERLTIRCILDDVRIQREADEESSRSVLIVRDYKSAWSADESELETMQRRIQAIAAWRHFGPCDVLRLEVANIRLGKVFTKDYYREDGLDDQIKSWWLHVATMVRGLEIQRAKGRRPAAPGRGCLACPYVESCEHARDFIERRGMHNTPELRATAYCVATAMREELAEQLRLDTDEGTIPVVGGVVGTVAKTRQKLKADGYQALWDRWEEHGGDELGFAKALGLTATNAKNMAKALYFDRSAKSDRENLIAEVTEPDTVREFGIHAEK